MPEPKKEISTKQYARITLRAASRPFEIRRYEWCQGNVCFLPAREERIIGHLFVFKGDIFCAFRILDLSESDYLLQLKRLIIKPERNRVKYPNWLKTIFGPAGREIVHKSNYAVELKGNKGLSHIIR